MSPPTAVREVARPDPGATHPAPQGDGGHGHSHGLVDPSITRSREGLRVVGVSLALLGATAAVQGAIYAATDSVALLADLIHNAGDALTAIPLAAAFLLRSDRAERGAGLAVVLTILASAVVAGVLAVERIVHPLAPSHLLALGLAGAVGVLGNAVAARVRLRGGRRLNSAALIADGDHARSDAIVSVGVVLSAGVVALGVPIADPIIGLAITALILRITWESWHTVRRHQPHHDHNHQADDQRDRQPHDGHDHHGHDHDGHDHDEHENA
jgi:divalent metal cation (Fe/Co/Zn/Cd) transporter